MDKIFYNESSAVKLGWSPDWFGATHFDEVLLEKVRTFPRDYCLTARWSNDLSSCLDRERIKLG